MYGTIARQTITIHPTREGAEKLPAANQKMAKLQSAKMAVLLWSSKMKMVNSFQPFRECLLSII